MLYEIARLASAGGRKQDALAILRKLGADSTEVLMDLLVEAMSLGERRGYYSALTHMSEGHDVIIAHLRHRTWYVVRNAAELCGEMDLERAVPDLAVAAGHEDERVRRSVAGALAKIASPQALEPLRRLLSDSVAAVRLRVAASLNLRRARSLVMPLAAQLSKETQPEVIKELTTVLGRIGTPDAVQALSGFAQPSTRMLGLGGRPAEHRVWAVEGLGHAGAAATQALKALSDDSDATVARAAQVALQARAG
jgi:HEAT repeat protein